MRKKCLKYLIILAVIFVGIFIGAKITITSSEQSKLKIFCSYHKKDKKIPIWKSDCVEPIQLGHALAKEDLGILGDDTGDNISYKNPNYGEMTAWYWVWKNYLPKNPDLEYIGFAHYRRFLDFCEYKKPGRIYYDNFVKIFKKFYNAKNIERYLDVDIIVPTLTDLGDETILQQYLDAHPVYDMEKMIEIVLAKYPQHEKIIRDTLNATNIRFCLNFVMKREIFEDFMEWIFPLLDELEKCTDWSDYHEYLDIRTPGYIVERFFNLWLNIYKSEHDVSIAEYRLLFLEEKPYFLKRLERYLRPKFRKIWKKKEKNKAGASDFNGDLFNERQLLISLS